MSLEDKKELMLYICLIIFLVCGTYFKLWEFIDG